MLRYTYGKGVTGKAHIRLGVWNEESNKADVFTSVVSDLVSTLIISVKFRHLFVVYLSAT